MSNPLSISSFFNEKMNMHIKNRKYKIFKDLKMNSFSFFPQPYTVPLIQILEVFRMNFFSIVPETHFLDSDLVFKLRN